MDIFSLVLQVLTIVAPVILLAGIGFAWVRLGVDYPVEFVTRMAMSLAVPALIFTALVGSEIEPAALRDTALAAVLAYFGVGLVSALFLRMSGLSQRTFLSPMVFGNTGNLGLPLALFAFGPEGLNFAVVVFAVTAFLSFTFGVWMVSGGKTPKAALREPIVWATVLGALFMTTGWSLPDWGMNALGLIGQMAIPLMLITLGVAVTRLRPASLGRAVWMSMLKLVICVAVPVGVGTMLALPPVAFAALVLQLATPVAVTAYMLAAKYGADAAEVAGLVVVSTVLAILAMPLLLGFLL